MKIKEIIECVSGSPQFRLKESLDKSAPCYYYYGQAELESDLIGMPTSDSDNKLIKTFDSVNVLDKGDAVFSLISGKGAIVQEIHQGYLFTQNYIKLIPNQKVNPHFLIYLLNEDVQIKRQLQMGLQGSSVMKYTVKELREIKLPTLPSIDKQQTIGNLYFNQLHLHALRERASLSETQLVLEKIRRVKEYE